MSKSSYSGLHRGSKNFKIQLFADFIESTDSCAVPYLVWLVPCWEGWTTASSAGLLHRILGIEIWLGKNCLDLLRVDWLGKSG